MTIPLDIKQASELVWAKAKAADLGEEAPDIIARAIHDERRRCATIAHAYLKDLAGSDLRDDEPELLKTAILGKKKP